MCERRRGRRRGALEGACTGADTMPQPWILRLILNAAALEAARPMFFRDWRKAADRIRGYQTDAFRLKRNASVWYSASPRSRRRSPRRHSKSVTILPEGGREAT